MNDCQLQVLAKVLVVSRRIAQDAPKKRGQYVFRAGIQWTLIDELRAALAEWEATKP